MAQPASPVFIFQGDRDISEHDDEVNKLINMVNNELPKLVNNELRLSTVHIPLPKDTNHGALLEVVYKFRRAGWDVSYINTNYCNDPVIGIQIGISDKGT